MMTIVRLPGRQHGAALIVGLLLLIVVTLVAISGIKSTSIQTAISTNMQERMLTYQTAESLIRQIVNEANDPAPPAAGTPHILNDAIQKSLLAVPETVPRTIGQAPTGVNADATVAFLGDGKALGYSIGGNATGFVYLVDSISNMPAANTQTNNQQGLMRIGPAASN
ncbi:PilX N-terminal domain-containing pilus assembly protein [Oceanococcus atlanticus]|nr:PilX N-terminal domain-containing pilus assembly protein [Oceanococcus atlanticus]RZO83028.1 MAG: hypothetical protein EVA65_15930 [Oceanococcus sp.]